MATTGNADVILTGPEKWEEFDLHFKTRAVAMGLWECINPYGKNPFLERPDRPEFKRYPREPTPPLTPTGTDTGSQTQ